MRCRFALFLLTLLILAPAALAQIPTAPTRVGATATDTQVTTTWTAVPGATSYNLYRSRTSGGEGTTPYTTGLANPYSTNGSVTNGVTYYYTVAAVNSSGTSPQSAEVSATPQTSLTTFYDNAGGTIYPNSPSHTWAGDYGFSGGAISTTTTAVTETSDPALYQDQRSGTSFTYAIPVTSSGNYLVTLYFAEIGGKTQGQRVFSVTSGSQTLLDHFDIYVAANGRNKAVTRSFTVKATGTTINLSFTGNTFEATVAAIQVARIPTGGGILSGVSGGPAAADVPPPGWAEDMIPSDSGSDADGQGPSDGLSVSLPSGAAEDAPGPDVWSYNPLGPSAAYSRLYRSKRAATGYESPGLSAGWTDNYDSFVTFNGSSTYTLTYPNGAQETWTGTTGTLATTSGSPYLVTQASGSITVTDKSHTKLTFTQFGTAAGNYPANAYLLTKITNLVGHSITLNRDTGSANGHHITSIVNDAASPQTLLSFAYSSGLLSSVTDTLGSRKAVYTFSGGNLQKVSQIAASSAPSQPTRWQYAYTSFGTPAQPYLTAITSPNPASPGGTTSASVVYYDTGTVALVNDAGGTTHTYTYGYPVFVQESNSALGLAEAHSQKYSASNKNVNTGITDAAGKSTSIAYSGTPSPYLPSAFTTRLANQTTSVTYDATGGKYGNVSATVDPRTVQTVMGYDYSKFALGEVTSVQESNLTTGATKQATAISYYGPSDGAINGLVKEVDTPTPDTVGGTTTVATTYAYTLPVFSSSAPAAGGQPSSVTEPGNPTSPTITTNYNYTSDGGTFIQNEALGEPITVTDNLGEVTHMRYNTQGDLVSVTDASGYETDYQYNLADQIISVIYPATTSGGGHAHTDTTYQYVGGPVQSQIVFDEGNIAVREVDTTYTPEGQVASVTGSTQPTSYTYDERYRPLTMTDGNSHTTLYDYDPIGNLLDIRYPLASGQFDTTTYGYDADQNLLSEVDGRGVTTTYSRSIDPESLVTKVTYSTLPANVTPIQPVNYTYDDFGRRSGMNDGDGATTGSYKYTYAYDDLDELLSQTVSFTGGPQNQTLSYAHNNDSSRLSLTIPGAGAVTNPLTINGGKFSYLYDGIGRLAQAQFPWNQGTWQHQYRQNGWLSQTNGPRASGSSYPLVQAQYFYNARGFLTTLENNTAYNDPYDDDQYGNGDTQQYGPAYTSMTYDALGNRLTEPASLPRILYHYPYVDPDTGDTYEETRFLAQDASHTLTYGYDSGHSAAANRDVMTGEMSVVSGSGSSAYKTAWTHGFAYDPAYNPTRYDYFNGASDQSYSPLSFNFDNQYSTGDFGFNWLYDGSGNPTTYKSATLAFDPEDRLTSAPTIAGGTFTAAYDGDGLRIKKTAIPVGGSSAVTTYFLYDGGSPVVEETWNGSSASFSAVNGLAADGWRARYDGGVVFDFAFDPQGSVVQRQTAGDYAAGAAAFDETFYEGYGALRQDYSVRAGGGSPAHRDPVGFGGQYGYYTDLETGLLCLTHRYYDPGTGKFINRDPIGYAGGANLYGFADGNPVNEIDPNGTDGTGTYWGDVGQVFAGYGDVLNPKMAYQSAKALYTIAKTQGAGAAGHAVVQGTVQSYTAWATTSDPRAFGQSFGTVLVTAATAAAPFAKGIIRAPNPILGKARIGSGLKDDFVKPIYNAKGEIIKEFPATPKAHGFPDLVDNSASLAKVFNLRRGAKLYQLGGSYNGVPGRFEWIVQNGKVTHRMFVDGGTINGIPIKP